jgi:hypothetical protein
MSHSFLMEAGRWILKGNWLERNENPMTVKGKTIIAWNQENWFTMVTKLIFIDGNHGEISFQYRGHLDGGERNYTYVLQQSLLGKVEGEGWIGPDSITQRYWVLGDKQRRSGFETFYRLNDDKYVMSSAVLAGHHLITIMEATLERQS